jgi:hypothetical protein
MVGYRRGGRVKLKALIYLETMNIETAIKSSGWWRQAVAMPDRHYNASAGISLADHLEAVHQNLRLLQPFEGRHEYFIQLQVAMESAVVDPAGAFALLTPVALLHDIGKAKEDKSIEGKHPLTGETVKMRHPILGVVAALELLPSHLSGRETILALIEEHDTPYSWFNQFQKTQQIPRSKSWAQLDRKIDPHEDGTGLILLSLFNLADTDGHENLSDISWLIEKVNENYLNEKGKWLPVPDQEALESLSLAGNSRLKRIYEPEQKLAVRPLAEHAETKAPGKVYSKK